MERQIRLTPIPTEKSLRVDEWRGLTSCRAGVIVPIAYFPLLREDRIRGRIAAQIRMDETVKVIVNPVRVTMQAHLIPKIALDRFEGSMETLNRSYKGENLPSGAAPPPWFVVDAAVATAGDDDLGLAVYDKLGIHYKSTTKIHTDIVESYNTVINWRRRAVSNSLPDVPLTDHSLKPAFWDSWKFDHIKPSFDAAMMDGAVPLTLQGETYVRTKGAAANGVREQIYINTGANGIPTVYAGNQLVADAAMTVDFSQAGASITLANMELARQTQAFAKLREQYQGVEDEYLIDLLMSGINVPVEDLKEPTLLARGSAIIGMQERYATDGASLDVSVANGMAALSLSINTPAINTGGIVLVTMEIVPEQLYERVEDHFLNPGDGTTAHLPDYLRDYLDPQKVEVVRNDYADTFHSTPAGVFGYAPLNHRWQRSIARVGGRFKRPVPDAFVEERQRIWSVEKADPELSDDFYICPDPFPHTVFADQNSDPFEVVTVGRCEIIGNTVFGGRFQEMGSHYEKVTDAVDTSRLKGDGTDATAPYGATTGPATVGGTGATVQPHASPVETQTVKGGEA